MKTLIIIDVQNDFIPGGSLAVPGGNEVIPVINGIQEKFDLVVATQDWHPFNHISFASNHKGKKPFEEIDLNGHRQVLWPEHCIQRSTGAELHRALSTARIEAIIRKGADPSIDSYSAFYDNYHLKSTGLAGYLREKGSTALWFCGLAADFCVYYSIRDAIGEGFPTRLITDAVKPINEESYKKLRQELASQGTELVTSDSIR